METYLTDEPGSITRKSDGRYVSYQIGSFSLARKQGKITQVWEKRHSPEPPIYEEWTFPMELGGPAWLDEGHLLVVEKFGRFSVSLLRDMLWGDVKNVSRAYTDIAHAFGFESFGGTLRVLSKEEVGELFTNHMKRTT